ncbi:MAG TPA: glycosyltransferase [Capsulimonadaceae bacterium]|jgi:glycosyltransferase involved in cell wall biosynthesis
MSIANTKVALVHDDLVQSGGAERVVGVLHELYPSAPIYTSIYDPKTTLSSLADADIRTSYMQKWPLACRKLHKLALTSYPVAFEQFDLSEYDVVISSSSRFAKGIITPPETCHICYCHTPARFAWRHHEYLAQSATTRLLSPLMRGMLSKLRAWDYVSAQRVDYFIANSANVAKRINKYYRRDTAAVIYPPIETKRFSAAPADEVGDHFLIVSRLVGYKRLDLAVEACTRLGLPLRIIGTGPEEKALKRIAGPTVSFLGRLPDKEVSAQYARCRALIFPGEEDFGMTPLECMASGRPVVGFGRGGALETIIDGQTGLFFHEQTVESLSEALVAMKNLHVLPELLQAHASRYDVAEFNTQMSRFVQWAVEEQRHRLNGPSAPQMRTSSVVTRAANSQLTLTH